VARLLVPSFRQLLGPRSCIQTSLLLQGILERFGYVSRVLAVTSIYVPSGNAAALRGHQSHDVAVIGQSFVFGNYDSKFRPMHGELTMPGFDLAAHAVVLVKQPATLVDLTADQLNTIGANLPPEILLSAGADFPEPDSRLVGVLPDGRVAAYDWIESDQHRLSTIKGRPATTLEVCEQMIRFDLRGVCSVEKP
jgi:hypothetical protein